MQVMGAISICYFSPKGIYFMELWKLPTGDSVSRYERSIVVNFTGPRKVLSTSLFNGGYHEDYTYVFNHDSKPSPGETMCTSLEDYLQHLHDVTLRLGFEPTKGTGIGTAAYMENVAIIEKSYKELTVTAIVTGGIDVNGGRVGDEASYYRPLEKTETTTDDDIRFKTGRQQAPNGTEAAPLGTINIILYIDGDLAEPLLARALVTCTEAKTAALQELQAGSHYSMGIATGSGTDQTIVVANSESPYYYDSAGKHSKLGELIGKAVKKAVKLALYKQTHLGPKQQHNLFKRLQRFGLSLNYLFESYMSEYEADGHEKFEVLNAFEKYARSNETVVMSAMWSHLVDEWLWGLLTDEELNLGLVQLGLVPVESSGSYPSNSLEYFEPAGISATHQFEVADVIRNLENHIINEVRIRLGDTTK